MYMYFRKKCLRFVDTLQFFQQPLADLSGTYNLDTIKGDFPHLFNTPENQNYNGVIPSEKYFGVKNMSVKKYKKFKEWYDTAKHQPWNFKDEMERYCKADVTLLSKAVLEFRKMFIKFDVDPFRYVTLPSLCMAIYRGKFLPDATIVANEQNKKVSTMSKEWFLYLNDKSLLTEIPLIIDTSKYMTSNTVECEKCDETDGSASTEYVSEGEEEELETPRVTQNVKPVKNYYNRPKTVFVPDAIDKKRKIIKEFYGCYFHGCPKCHPNLNEKYIKTCQRETILRNEGYTVDVMWECEWYNIKKSLPDKEAIEEKAKKQNIITRDALFGGRTECFKRYVKCSDKQKIFYYDVVSLYPIVNALDDYAVGFKRYVDTSIDDILNDKFIGLVRCDVIPPDNLYIPGLPDNGEGK